MGNTPDCGGCRFGALGKAADGSISFSTRICKRYPPAITLIPNGQGGAGLQALFPIVPLDGWCGEYTARDDIPLPGETPIFAKMPTNRTSHATQTRADTLRLWPA